MAKVIIPGVAPGRYTEKELQHAAEDARAFVADCKAAQVCMAVDIIARRLFLVARGQLDAIIEEGWEIDNLALVVQTLVMSAQEKATTQFTVAELAQGVRETLLPFLDLLVAQEQQSHTVTTSNHDQERSPNAA